MTEIPVLYYHSIANDPLSVSPRTFGSQMEWLHRQGFVGLSVANWLAGHSEGHRAVVITFDDGFAGVFEHALPILRELNFHATVFVPTSYPGTLLWGDPATKRWSQLQTPQAVLHRMMTWDELSAFAEAGCEIGGHTVTHRELTRLDSSEAREEVTACRAQLQERLGVHVSAFCYPRGQYTTEIQRFVAEAGYQCAFTTQRGLASSQSSPFALPRFPVGNLLVDLQRTALLRDGAEWNWLYRGASILERAGRKMLRQRGQFLSS